MHPNFVLHNKQNCPAGEKAVFGNTAVCLGLSLILVAQSAFPSAATQNSHQAQKMAQDIVRIMENRIPPNASGDALRIPGFPISTPKSSQVITPISPSHGNNNQGPGVVRISPQPPASVKTETWQDKFVGAAKTAGQVGLAVAALPFLILGPGCGSSKKSKSESQAPLCPNGKDPTTDACTPYKFNGNDGSSGNDGWGWESGQNGENGENGDNGMNLQITLSLSAGGRTIKYNLQGSGLSAGGEHPMSSQKKIHIDVTGGNGGDGGHGAAGKYDYNAFRYVSSGGDGGDGGHGGNGGNVTVMCNDGSTNAQCNLLTYFEIHLNAGQGGSGGDGGAGYPIGRNGRDGTDGSNGTITVVKF